jgi:hypothetical protein
MIRLLIVLGLIVVLIGGAIPVMSSVDDWPVGVEPMAAPHIKVKDGTSTNWAGYAAVQGSLASPNKGAISYAAGTWQVPAVICSSSHDTYSSAWVGIDGYASNTVEQIGTSQDCRSGNPTYYAWYEMYPKWPANLKHQVYPVLPGDTVTAKVEYLPSGKGQFKLSISNNGAVSGSAWSFSTTQKSGSAARSSAEWIMEAPWSSGVLPLANFGAIGFSGGQATIGNVTGPIGSWTNDRIDMIVSASNPAVKAQTSDLSSKKTPDSFTVTWKQE